MDKIKLLFHTLKYLKKIQIYARLTLLLKISIVKSFIITNIRRSYPNTEIKGINGLIPKASTESHSIVSKGNFKFLNKEVKYEDSILWNDPEQEKLWLYNLHYFDYLLPFTQNPQERNFLQAKRIIVDWIKNNPIGFGNGWEPYPISLRAINWIFFYSAFIKYFDNDPDFKQQFMTSLYRQIHYLNWFLEFHLLANHLWANIKALLFAGIFFDNKKWMKEGLKLIKQELDEQILPDGGHYECSPMYHSIILSDVLDLYNLLTNTVPEKSIEDLLVETAHKMLHWLNMMTHPDGKITLFGDSALGIAPELKLLKKYADDLGILNAQKESQKNDLISALTDSGYYILKTSHDYFVFDAGELGVHYQPGHVHCDLLSYEYSYNGKRFIVDSGVGNYLPGDLRQKARSIFAHNTVVVNGMEQAEIWSAFRVGRRVKNPFVKIKRDQNSISGTYSNDLNKKYRYTHCRTIIFTVENGFKIIDEVFTESLLPMENIIHVHPDVDLQIKENRIFLQNDDDTIRIDVDHQGCKIDIRDWFYVPEFGKIIPAKMIVINMSQKNGSYSLQPL